MLLLGDLSVRSDYKIALVAHLELFLVRKPLTCPVVLVVPVVLVPAFARRELQIKEGLPALPAPCLQLRQAAWKLRL